MKSENKIQLSTRKGFSFHGYHYANFVKEITKTKMLNVNDHSFYNYLVTDCKIKLFITHGIYGDTKIFKDIFGNMLLKQGICFFFF